MHVLSCWILTCIIQRVENIEVKGCILFLCWGILLNILILNHLLFICMYLYPICMIETKWKEKMMLFNILLFYLYPVKSTNKSPINRWNSLMETGNEYITVIQRLFICRIYNIVSRYYFSPINDLCINVANWTHYLVYIFIE